MFTHELNRREALRSLAGLTAALLVPSALLGQTTQPGQASQSDRMGKILPMRKLGSRGPMVTMLGMGGWHVGNMRNDLEAQRAIEAAIAGGVRYFDTAANYQGGQAESRYGRFLTPRYRDIIFLTSKSLSTDAREARSDLDATLGRLKTDHLDLWLMHSIHTSVDATMRINQGVGDAFQDALQRGKVKHIGFSGHVSPAAHLRMLELAKQKSIPFTACQMPINVADPSYSSFILNVVPKAIEMGLGVLAMKTLSNGGFFGGQEGKPGPNPKLIPDRISVADAMHFVWSLPVSVAISGADSAEMINEKIELARGFSGMSEERRKELIAKVADRAGVVVEVYKENIGPAPGAGRKRGRRMILVLCRDLLFTSKINSTAQAAGVPVRLVRDPTKLNEVPDARRLIVDLAQAGFLEAAADWKAKTGGHVTGFTGHTDTDTIERAKSLGFDAVFARGAFSGNLEAILKSAHEATTNSHPAS